MENRRKYSRVVMMLRGEISSEFVEGSAPIKVIDVSLNGALIELLHPDEFKIFIAHRYIIEFSLDASTKITMKCFCRHKRGNRIGMQCCDIDVDSISTLRRLIELNVGTSKMLNRELEELMHADGML